jgi:hypothetical protein
MVVAEGRLLAQWCDELADGAPGRGLPPLAPNVAVLVLLDQSTLRSPGRSARSTVTSAIGPPSCW